MGKRIVTPPAVVSFPSLFEARPDPGGREKYSVTLIFKGGKGVQPLRDAAEQVAIDKWGKVPPRCKFPFRDGEEYEDKDGYEPGDVFVQFTRAEKDGPPILAGPGQRPLGQSEVYPGCIGRVATKPYAWHHQESNKKGVSFPLDAFQWVRDGEPLGSFEPVDVDIFDDGLVTAEVEE